MVDRGGLRDFGRKLQVAGVDDDNDEEENNQCTTAVIKCNNH